MICSMTDLILDIVVCYNRLLYICDMGFNPGLDFGLGLDSRGRGQTLEAEAEAKTLEAEADAEAGYFGLEAEARPRGLTSLVIVRVKKTLSILCKLKSGCDFSKYKFGNCLNDQEIANQLATSYRLNCSPNSSEVNDHMRNEYNLN